MKSSTRRWLGIGLTALLLALIVYRLTRSQEWRAFDWNRLWYLLAHAQAGYLMAAVATAYLTYFLRALRWKYFLEPIKSASLWSLFAGQILGFSAIFLIGRPGEVVRPAYIAAREDVSFASQLAILILERVYDTVFTLILFGVALYFQPIHPTTAREALHLRRIHQTASSVLLLVLLVVTGLVLFRLYSEPLIAWLSRRFRFVPGKFRSYLGRFLRSLSAGLDAIRNWRDLLATLACTLILWFLNVSVFWLVFHSLGGALSELSWWAAGIVLFFAAAGLLVQLPGVGGGFQVAAIQALRQIFHVRPVGATSAGILMWIVTLVPCVALGLVVLLYEGLSWQKLGSMARAKRDRGEIRTGAPD
jgi:glycosyltransferase 2 family protein